MQVTKSLKSPTLPYPPEYAPDYNYNNPNKFELHANISRPLYYFADIEFRHLCYLAQR